MIRHHGIFLLLVLLLVVASLEACAADQPQFAVKETHRDVNGVTVKTAIGTMRIEVCGDRVIHVVASPTSEIPTPKVPIVTQPCRAKKVQIKVGPRNVEISTPALTATVDAASGAVSFLSADGKLILGEPQQGGKAFDVPSVFEAKTWQVQQTFLSSPDESLYGLGQHQEGIFNVRGVPIRLSQANTNISIPVVLSSNGYGILWNNPSLTDFNPADQEIEIDPQTGKGKFTTGAKGSYGFLLSSDNKDKLIVEVSGQRVIDLENMWTPTSASGSVNLEANKEYEVTAQGGPGGVQLAVRRPQDTTTFRSEVGQAVDYYFFYGPELNRVTSDYRQLTGEAPLFPKWAYRWFEYGAFCPIFRVHGYKSKAEIWNYGPQAESILTQYDELRYRLMPYIYSAAWGVTNNGETLMRSLPLEFTSDAGARAIADQFMFGRALLINPVTTEGATQRNIYLPAGTDWVDFWTGKREQGGQSITGDAPLARMPIYVRAGSIVPYGPRVESATAKADPIELRIYAGANGEFSLYDDEGDNYDYEHGAHSVIPMRWDDKAGKLMIGDRQGSFAGMLEHRTFHVVRVADGRGAGIAPTSEADATIEYDGKATSVQVHPRP